MTTIQTERLTGSYKQDTYAVDVLSVNGKLMAKPSWEEGVRELIPANKTQFIRRDGQQTEFIYEGDNVVAAKLLGDVIVKKMK